MDKILHIPAETSYRKSSTLVNPVSRGGNSPWLISLKLNQPYCLLGIGPSSLVRFTGGRVRRLR